MRYEPVTGDFRPVVDIFFSEGDKEVMDLFDRLVVRYEELARKNKVSPAPENLRSIQERCEADYKLHKFRKPLWHRFCFSGSSYS